MLPYNINLDVHHGKHLIMSGLEVHDLLQHMFKSQCLSLSRSFLNIKFSGNEQKTHKMCDTVDKLDIRFKRLLKVSNIHW